MKSVKIIIVCMVFLLFSSGVVFADWQTTMSKHFDIAITFDDCADWTPSTAYGMDSRSKSDMPVCSSSPPITYYSDWDSSAAVSPYIDDFSTKVGSTGKSLRMNINASGDYGPSRVGGYFGNGSADSGYQEMFFFYRAFFPKGYFPDGLVYEKLLNFSHGFTDTLEWNGLRGLACNADGESCRMPYGISSFVPHAVWSGPSFTLRAADYYTGTYPYDSQRTDAGSLPEGQWVSFEYRLKLDDSSADSDEVDIWIYGPDGSGKLVFSDRSARLHNLAISAGHKFNWFFIGGNSDNAGSSVYYVDDVVINSKRIGPDYFTMLSGGDIGTDPVIVQPPGNVSIIANSN